MSLSVPKFNPFCFVGAQRGWKSSKVAEIKEEMEFIKEKFYKLHKGKIISLQFLKPTVEIPYGLDDFNKKEEDWQKSKNNVYQEIEGILKCTKLS